MTGEAPRPVLLDDVSASVARLRGTKAGLEARSKELDELETRLEADRIRLKGRAEAVESARSAFLQQRDDFARIKSTLDQDAAAAETDRKAAATEAEHLQEWTRVLQDRDRVLRESEDRIERRSVELSARMEESKARLLALAEREDIMAQRERDFQESVARLTSMGQAIEVRDKELADREEELVRRQNDRLAALSARESQIAAFRDGIDAVAAEITRQSESYAALKAALGEDMDRLVVARESLVAEEERLLEADAILAGATGSTGAGSDGGPLPTDPAGPAETLRADPPKDAAVGAEAASAPLPPVAENPDETANRLVTTKDLAVGRLAQVVAAWERARAAGSDVSDLRGSARSVRDALASGDYEGAMRLATTILDRLQTTPGAE